MASIQKRGDGRYRVRYYGPDGKERSKTFTRRVDADAFRSQVEVDLRGGKWIDPSLSRLSVAEWAQMWSATTVDLRASTRARDDSYLRNHVLPRFGSTPLGRVDHLSVRTWVAELNASGLKPATVHKVFQVLSKLMKTAVESGLLASSPCTGIALPRIDNLQDRFLTPEEVARLVEAVDPRYRSLIDLLAWGGLRISEALGLTAEHVNPLHRRVEVVQQVVEVQGHLHLGPPKTARGRRSVPLPRGVMEGLAADLAGRDPHDFVFQAPLGGPVRLQTWRRRYFDPAVKRADLQPLRVHDLRHTAVSFWIAGGASANEIARRAGHSSVVTVLNRYGHLLPGTEERVTEALDDMRTTSRRAVAAGGRVQRLDP